MHRISVSLTVGNFLLLFSLQATLAQPPTPLVVDISQTLVSLKGKPFGINLNYARDEDKLRPTARPLATTLKEMEIGWLRYPGGEKSDWYLWSKEPFTSPSPQAFGYYRDEVTDPMDFDEYMVLVRATGAEPYVVVGYDNTRTGISKAQYLKNAVEWVRYANITRKYGVKNWEIGNENWHNNTGTPTNVARDVAEISKAMKAVDPTIHTGASGNGDSWWNAYLSADPEIDFLVISNYTGMSGGYQTYAQAESFGLLGGVQGALNAIDRLVPVEKRAEKSVVLAEFNSKDYGGSWADGNNLGHALVNFDNIGQILLQPRIKTGMLWNTRWMDLGNTNSLFYALDPENGMLPPARVLAIWGQHVLDRMVFIGNLSGVAAFASASTSGDKLNIFLLNKRTQELKVELTILNAPEYEAMEINRYSGIGEADTQPVWARVASPVMLGNPISTLQLLGVSVTVISLRTKTLGLLWQLQSNFSKHNLDKPNYFNLLGQRFGKPELKLKALAAPSKLIAE